MLNYILKRLSQSVIVLIGVVTICFFIFQHLGDVAYAIASVEATEQQIREIRTRYGLDLPLHQQYVRFVWRACQGDFGNSYLTKTPALPLILERIPATLELALAAMFFATALATIIGVWAAVFPKAASSKLAMVGTLGGISMPTFLTGILLIYFFALKLNWLPAFSRGEVVKITSWWSTGFLSLSGLKHMILPGLTLGFYQLAMSTRIIRGEMVEVLCQDYIRTAKAKGLSTFGMVCGHAIKNAMIPFITVIGLQLGGLIAFAIVVETVFQWPGMGNLIITSIGLNDQPVVVAYIMVISLMFVFINLAVDIIYCFLNPRIAYE